MKKALIMCASVATVAFLSGCATQTPRGGIMIDNTLPGQGVDNSVRAKKVGKATSFSYLGLVAVGDSSISAAMKNGNITKVNRVEHQVASTLGFKGEYTTIVYGE